MSSFFELATKRRKGLHGTAGPHTTFPGGPAAGPASEPESRTVISTIAEPTVDEAPLPQTGTPLIAACGLFKSYWKGKLEVPVLRDVDFEVQEKEFVSIIGQSGSGKSTLLHVLGTLDGPDAGEVHFKGNRIDNLSTRRRDELRNKQLGMIFQFYHLLPEVTTLENVLMPIMIAEGMISYWRRKREYIERAKQLLDMVGLSHRLEHRPRELSGGEMQRAAIARSLISQPQLLFADEPTGNLDRKNGEEVLKILRTLNEEQNLTIVMVTHDAEIAAQADRTVRLFEGRVQLV
jgi:lipoprotein-releasing system ATP-binding protein